MFSALRSIFLVTLISVSAFVSSTSAQSQGGMIDYRPTAKSTWAFSFSPLYGIPATSGDATFGPIETSDVDVGLGESPGNIRPWLNLNFEAVHRPSRLGFAINFSYTELENSIDGPSRFFSFDTDIVRTQLDALGIFRMAEGSTIADLYGGVRLTSYSVESGGQDSSGFFEYDETYDPLDPVVGLRVLPRVSENVSLHFQGDVGVGGDSDTLASAMAGLAWKTNDVLSFVFLYRADWIDFEDEGDGFQIDTVTHGPIFGLKFEFDK